MEASEDHEESAKPVPVSCLPNLSEEERRIYQALDFRPIPVDQLVSETDSASDVMRILTKLEIKGLVRKAPGGKVVLADRAEA